MYSVHSTTVFQLQGRGIVLVGTQARHAGNFKASDTHSSSTHKCFDLRLDYNSAEEFVDMRGEITHLSVHVYNLGWAVYRIMI